MRISTVSPILAILLLSGCEFEVAGELTDKGFVSGTAKINGNESSYTSEITAGENATIEPDTATVVDNNTNEPLEEEIVQCDPCQSERTIDLQWQPENEAIAYRIYYGPSSDSIDQMMSVLSATTPDFDLAVPAVSYHAWNDMGLYDGDTVCFTIETYSEGTSPAMSNAVCGVLTA